MPSVQREALLVGESVQRFIVLRCRENQLRANSDASFLEDLLNDGEIGFDRLNGAVKGATDFFAHGFTPLLSTLDVHFIGVAREQARR